MPFLIDGHNLIAALPDIDISDPYDEAELILKLRSWAAREGRQAVVVFDGGVPGGLSQGLSGGGLEVVFAARGYTDADRIIAARVRRLPDPANWTVVSSDREVRDIARRVGTRVLRALEFAEQVERPEPPPREKPEQPSQRDVETWLEVFGKAEGEPPEPAVGGGEGKPPRPQKTSRTSPSAPRSSRTIGEQVGRSTPSERPVPSEKPREPASDEVDAWLEAFGEVTEGPPPPPPRPRPKRPRPKKGKRRVAKQNPDQLSEADVEAWLEVFPEEKLEDEPGVPPTELPLYEHPQPQRSSALQRNRRRIPRLNEEKEPDLDEEDLEQWYRLYGKEPDK